jgi:hypothetical protein
MTCIVGLEHEGSVYIGGDSAGVSGLDIHVRTDEKVFTNGNFIFGFTTSFRMGQLLQYSFVPPEQPEDKSDMAYLVTDFIDEIRSCFTVGGFLTKLNDVEEGGCFLLGYKGKLYEISSDFQVGSTSVPFSSVGCGAALSKGAMFATTHIKDPEDRIRLALDAAEYFSAGVCKPYKILKK